MKTILISALAIGIITFTACNSGDKSSEKHDEANHDQMAMDSSGTSAEKVDAPVIKASFTNVNADVKAHINEVLSHYFHVKHALTKDDAAEAKNGATMLLQVISQFDNSLLSADQKQNTQSTSMQ